MIEAKVDFSGGMNRDDGYQRLPPNCYIDALNITRDSVSENSDQITSNIVGNRLIDYTLPAGTNVVIGSVGNPLRNTAISLVYNSNGFHSIVEYNLTSRSSAKVFQNLTDSGDEDILGFTLAGKITGINIVNRDEGDLLFFLDSIGRPTFLNITLFKAGEYTPVTRQIIDVAALWPYTPASAIYGNDNTRTSNHLQKKLFRFKYRWVLDDNLKTTYSPISSIPLPVNILNPVFTNVLTNNNRITVSLQSGAKNVKGIELAVSIQNNQNVFGRFQTVEYFDKEEDGIADDSSFSIGFYNDSTYPFISDEESDLLFSWVPRLAVSQETPNGNVLAYGAITEGYDRDLEANVELTVNTVAAGEGISVGSLNAVSTFISHSAGQDFWSTAFSGTPAIGTMVTITLVRKSDMQTVNVGTVTTTAGDTASSVAVKMKTSMDTIGIAFDVEAIGNSNVWKWSTDDYNLPLTTTVTPPVSSANTNSIATWPFWRQRRVGIAYFDEKGITNGVIYDGAVTFPAYTENVSDQVLLPYINIKIFHVPPIWAYSYSIAFTKDNTEIKYIETVDVNTTESEYLYFDISNLPLNQQKNPTTSAVVSWTFQDGDRMKLIRRMSDGNVFSSAYDSAIEGIVVAPTINNVTQVDKTFVKIRKVAPFAAENYSSDFFIIQLYRPTLQEPNNENATFYECGLTLQILDPGTDTRRHAGLVSDQSDDYVTPAETDVYEGDVYFRVRNEVLGETGVGTFFVQDRNFVDTNISAVSNIDGRALVIDINAKETFFPALIRYSLAYQVNTNINQLNIFLQDSFLECDYTYGTIQRLKVRARFMRVYQQLRTGVIYLFSKIAKSPAGDDMQVVTSDLLNPIQYYNYDAGIGDQKESLASFNDADYFTSNVNPGVYRVSLDGITPLHLLYKMNSWAVENLPLRTGLFKVYGGYDQRLNNYICALEEAPLDGQMIINLQGKIESGLFNNRYLFALSGDPSTGDVVSIYLIDGDGIERTYSYTVQDGDTILEICQAVEALIDADIYFTALTTTIFPEAGVVIQQVTSNNPTQFNGLASIAYTTDSASAAQTLAFSEEDNTFDGFLSLKPENICSVGSLLVAFLNGQCWTQDSDQYNTFFGVEYESYITYVFNAGNLFDKTYVAIQQRTNNGVWDCPEIETQSMSYGTTPQQSNLVAADFEKLEGKWSASFLNDVNSIGGVVNGDSLKGSWIKIKFRKQSATQFVSLDQLVMYFISSELNLK